MAARRLEATKDKLRDVYITDTLRMIAKSLGTYPAKRYLELLEPPTQDKRSGDEIAADIIKRAGIKVMPAASERGVRR